jgi:hypothetical protein
MKYRLFTFHAVDDQKRVVYHTNVVMSICSKVSIICLDAILDSTERNLIKDTLSHVLFFHSHYNKLKIIVCNNEFSYMIVQGS